VRWLVHNREVRCEDGIIGPIFLDPDSDDQHWVGLFGVYVGIADVVRHTNDILKKTCQPSRQVSK
jgi:hypothetical protein